MKNIALLILTIIMISCNKKTEKDNLKPKSSNKVDFFEPANLGAFGSKTRLIIYAYFDECGEWGGHEESFEIFSKHDQEFYAEYTRTKVDCEKIGALYGKPEFQQAYVKKELKLENKQKVAINKYLLSLLKSKIKERFPGHAGQTFGAMKTDSTFVVDVYDRDKKNLENYNRLLKEFNLEIVK